MKLIKKIFSLGRKKKSNLEQKKIEVIKALEAKKELIEKRKEIIEKRKKEEKKEKRASMKKTCIKKGIEWLIVILFYSWLTKPANNSLNIYKACLQHKTSISFFLIVLLFSLSLYLLGKAVKVDRANKNLKHGIV